VPYASVEFPDLRRAVLCDSAGAFQVDLPPGRHRLRARRTGFDAAEIDVDLDASEPHSPIEVRLAPRAFRVAPVVVRARRRADAAAEAARRPGRWVLGAERIERQIAGFEDVLRSVQALPGVGRASDLHAEFTVHGSGTHANALLLDGIEVFFPYHILGFNSIFDAGIVESAEFWSGGMPAEYGDATGGVLVLRTRGTHPTTERGRAGLSYVSAHLRYAEGDARRSAFLSLRRSYHDKLLQLVGSPAGRLVPEFHDVFLRGRHRASPRHELAAGLLVAGDGLSLSSPEVRAEDLGFVAVDPASRERAVREFAALGDRLELQNAIVLGTLQWRAVLGERSYLETTLGRVAQDFAFALRGDNRESVRIASGVTHLRGDLTWALPRHRMRAGWYGWRDDTAKRVSAWAGILTLRESNSSINLMDLKERWEIDAARRRDYLALYAQDDWEVRPRWTLGGGLRLERDGLLDRTHWSPRLALEWRPDARWNVRGTWGLRHALRDKPMEVLPTPDGRPLGAERASETTLGTTTDLGRGVRAGGTVWIKRQSNLVYEPAPARYAQGGIGRARGMDFWVRWEPAGRPYRAGVAWSWTRARQRDPVAWRRQPDYYATDPDGFWHAVYETPYWYSPAHDERHRVDLDAGLRRGRWELGLRYQLGSGRPYTPVRWVATDPLNVKYGIVGPRGSARYPVYQRLDVRIQRTLRQGRVDWSLYADVLNATAADNVYQYRYNPAYTARYTVKMLPTLPAVGVEARF
jgi:hypothetical protein